MRAFLIWCIRLDGMEYRRTPKINKPIAYSVRADCYWRAELVVCEMACLGITNKVVLPVTQFAILPANNKKERDSTSNKDNYTPGTACITLLRSPVSLSVRLFVLLNPSVFFVCVLRARIALGAPCNHLKREEKYLLMRRAKSGSAILHALRASPPQWRYHESLSTILLSQIEYCN